VETKSIQGLQEGMKMKRIADSDLIVSEVCLGTMTFGEQIDEATSHVLLDKATKELGINFIDTAESYPVPSCPSTAGMTEKIIGTWLKKQKREDVIISTKVCGHSDQITWCRNSGEGTRLSKNQIVEAVDGQLRRLGTDYIDLLSFHWPDRYVPLFGAPEYSCDLERDDATSVREQLEVIQDLMKSGKIRNFGLSNETPYGATKFATTATLLDLPRPVAVQQVYNLLCRNDFENGMLEACSCANSDMSLLAYSPLAGGALSGKYLHPAGVSPEARMRKFVGFMHRYVSTPSMDAIIEYMKIADTLALPLSTIASAFVYSRPYTTSTIVGATNVPQLEENVRALNLPISDEVLHMINKVYKKHTDPTKGVFEVVDPNVEYVDPTKLPWGAKDQDVDPELDVLINQRLSKF
jgi:aryl-alcohol dehydrogenase-like predicted oxidoreductase